MPAPGIRNPPVLGQPVHGDVVVVVRWSSSGGWYRSRPVRQHPCILDHLRGVDARDRRRCAGAGRDVEHRPAAGPEMTRGRWRWPQSSKPTGCRQQRARLPHGGKHRTAEQQIRRATADPCALPEVDPGLPPARPANCSFDPIDAAVLVVLRSGQDSLVPKTASPTEECDHRGPASTGARDRPAGCVASQCPRSTCTAPATPQPISSTMPGTTVVTNRRKSPHQVRRIADLVAVQRQQPGRDERDQPAVECASGFQPTNAMPAHISAIPVSEKNQVRRMKEISLKVRIRPAEL